MFSFLNDMGNYESRKVRRDDFDWGFVSTARVSDGRKDYETAVKHNGYRCDGMVIVECYDTHDEAETGHAKWVKTMTTEPLPEKLIDCANAELGQLLGALGDEMTYERKVKD